MKHLKRIRNDLRKTLVVLEEKLLNFSESEIDEYGRQTYNREFEEMVCLRLMLDMIHDKFPELKEVL